MRLVDSTYQYVLKPVLFRCDPERVHNAFVSLGEFSGRVPPLRSLLAALYRYRGPNIAKTVDGIRYETPVLLSAGFDTDGRLTQVLRSLSFGGEEIGSITAKPCEGNPRPRLTRLVRNRSIVVYKGLRNKGVDALMTRLKRTPRVPGYVLGISLARSNDAASCADSAAGIADYVESFTKLNAANVGDYYTINISCPNAFGGEAFTTPPLLTQLLDALDAVPTTKPVYIKMPINLTWEEFDALLTVAAAHRIQGVVIGNLNKDYRELDYPEDAPKEYRGGLSGKPTRARSTDLIRRTRATYGKRFTIFGVGGILSPEDAMEKFDAGADLIMLITGMIMEGPGLIREICERYAEEHIA
jgi:dihydroorotate dehydrogenase